jgi:hypothetical protein
MEKYEMIEIIENETSDTGKHLLHLINSRTGSRFNKINISIETDNTPNTIVFKRLRYDLIDTNLKHKVSYLISFHDDLKLDISEIIRIYTENVIHTTVNDPYLQKIKTLDKIELWKNMK